MINVMPIDKKPRLNLEAFLKFKKDSLRLGR